MESVYNIVAIRVHETSWAPVWRLRSCYLGTGYDNRALRAAIITIGWLTGAFVVSQPTTAPTRHYSCDSGCSGLRLIVASLLLLLLVAVAAALGLGPKLGLLSPFVTWAPGEYQAWPYAALAHLSTRLKSAETSWTSWVVSFSSIFSSLTP
jgi:hypothetical protein